MSLDLHDIILHNLPPEHFLAQPRPDAAFGPPMGAVDTTTVAAHDFDVDTRTGFMPPQAPLTRLPEQWEHWEATLDDAVASELQLGDKRDLSDQDKSRSERWRARVREVSASVLESLFAYQNKQLTRCDDIIHAYTIF